MTWRELGSLLSVRHGELSEATSFVATSMRIGSVIVPLINPQLPFPERHS